jgi:hypothetical protein
MKGISIQLAVLALLTIAAPSDGQTVSPLISISPAEFLKLPEEVRAVYVGGVLDGVTFMSYGNGVRLPLE